MSKRCGSQHPTKGFASCGRYAGHEGPHREMNSEDSWTDGALPSSGQPATKVDQEFYTEPEVIRLREEVNTLKAVASSERERLKLLITKWREPVASPEVFGLETSRLIYEEAQCECADELAALLAEGK